MNFFNAIRRRFSGLGHFRGFGHAHGRAPRLQWSQQYKSAGHLWLRASRGGLDEGYDVKAIGRGGPNPHYELTFWHNKGSGGYDVADLGVFTGIVAAKEAAQRHNEARERST